MKEQPIGSVRYVAVSATIPNLQVGSGLCRVAAAYRSEAAACFASCPQLILVINRPAAHVCCSLLQDLAEWLSVPPAGIKCFGGWAGALWSGRGSALAGLS